MLSFPITMFGSIVVVINNLPFFNDATKGTLSTLFGNGQNATMSIMTVLLLSVSAIICLSLMMLKGFLVALYLLQAFDSNAIFHDYRIRRNSNWRAFP